MAKAKKRQAAAKSKKSEEEKEAEEKPVAKEEAGEAKGKGKKRKAGKTDAAAAETKLPKLAKKVSVPDSLGDVDYTASSKSASGKEANFKIASWNINGIRAWLEKEGPSYISIEKPDILCVQELKCDISKIPAETAVEGYTTHWLSADTPGYSGVGIYYKAKPISITDGIGVKAHDNEGRVITAEYDKFYLVNTYIPNSGKGLVRLKYRTGSWDMELQKYLKKLDEKKPVIWCGDLNVAHKEIDLKNPKTNKKTAGFTQEERDSFSSFLDSGFIDSYRQLYPDVEEAFTFWTYMMNARAKNTGWRLDYFIMSERFKEHLCDSRIRSKVLGSDHCPITLHLHL